MKKMETIDPKIYLGAALSQIPRVLTLQDRNPFSKTYGCFHRSFWLHRTADFPSAINQMGVNILALVWAKELKDNPYYKNRKILDWCLAGIKYWMGLQHSDGSFDEWYPNERGWAGPTGYLVHAMADSFFLLGDAFPEEIREEFIRVIQKAGHYLTNYNEEFILANHHAIALLPIYEAYLITKDEKLLEGFNKKFMEFQKHCYDEGWSLEYDGVDIGYLSGTISFLSRLYKHWPDKKIEGIINRAVEFTSYHLYPNGSFGGTIGSRQTSHFYHFGYEFWANKNPLAARMAETGLKFLSEGKLVSPSAQEDHYLLYRVAEYVEAYLAYQIRPEDLPLLPSEREDFDKYFPKAGLYIRKKGQVYSVINLKRGGVVKTFDVKNNRMMLNNSGWIGKLSNGKTITSQWNDPEYKIDVDADAMSVQGDANYMVMKTFTPWKMIFFRAFMLMFGWHPASAYKIKAVIRRFLMVGTRRAPVDFKRSISFSNGSISIQDDFRIKNGVKVDKVYIGDEMPVRYVPQSRYFQLFELEAKGNYLSPSEMDTLNKNKSLTVSEKVDL